MEAISYEIWIAAILGLLSALYVIAKLISSITKNKTDDKIVSIFGALLEILKRIFRR